LADAQRLADLDESGPQRYDELEQLARALLDHLVLALEQPVDNRR